MAEPMKLLALPTSPFSARVLIQAREKRLDLPVAYPSEGRGVAEHAARNPFLRIPVLVVGETFVIESAAIQEYLEDVYPAPPLRPADPLDRARMRALVLAVDHYLFAAISKLRGRGDAVESAAHIPPVNQALDRLQRLMDDTDTAGYACGAQLSLADCALAPAVFYLERFLRGCGYPSALESHKRLSRWWQTVTDHDSVSGVIAQLERAANLPGR
jgi:glutathione S-transferase